MRKLRPAEVALLMSAMAIGTASADDTCEMTPGCVSDAVTLSTVQVSGVYTPITSSGASTPNYYTLPNGNAVASGIFPSNPPPSPTPIPDETKRKKIFTCVAMYSQNPINPSFDINYRTFYTWKFPTQSDKAPDLLVSTGTPIPPNTGNLWNTVYGITTYDNTNFSSGHIYIYEAGFASMQQAFITLAHEEAHADGLHSGAAAEYQAEQEAQAAYDSYLRDNGAKCGGSM